MEPATDSADGIELDYCLVVAPMLGQKEGYEHEKVLYYDPPSAPAYIQSRDAGLAAALIGFTKQFSPDRPVETVVTQKTVQVFHQAEEDPDLWFVLSVKRPSPGSRSQDKRAKGSLGKKGGAERGEPDGGDADGCAPLVLCGMRPAVLHRHSSSCPPAPARQMVRPAE